MFMICDVASLIKHRTFSHVSGGAWHGHHIDSLKLIIKPISLLFMEKNYWLQLLRIKADQ